MCMLFLLVIAFDASANWVTIAAGSIQNNYDEGGNITTKFVLGIYPKFKMSVYCTSDDGKNEKITFTDIGDIECDGTTHTHEVALNKLNNQYTFNAGLANWYDDSGGAATVYWSAEFIVGEATSPTSGVLHPRKGVKDKCAVDVNTEIDFGQLERGNTNSASFTKNLVKDSSNGGVLYVIPGSSTTNGGVIKNEEGSQIPYDITGGTWVSGLGMYAITSDEAEISVSVPSDITSGKYTDTATVIVSCE